MLMGDYPRKGRPIPIAPRPQPFRRRGRIGVRAVAFLTLLLLAPAYALCSLSKWIDWRMLATVPVAVSLVTYLAYRHDKRRAEENDRRVPEQTLHLLELTGGWPVAYLAQQQYRHKTAKGSYQFAFWCIVAMHQLLALDALTSWHGVRTILARLTRHFAV